MIMGTSLGGMKWRCAATSRSAKRRRLRRPARPPASATIGRADAQQPPYFVHTCATSTRIGVRVLSNRGQSRLENDSDPDFLNPCRTTTLAPLTGNDSDPKPKRL